MKEITNFALIETVRETGESDSSAKPRKDFSCTKARDGKFMFY